MIVADDSLKRRVAELERTVAMMETMMFRDAARRSTTPIAGRLWRFTLNEAFSSNTAEADLLRLDGTDTDRDVDVYDPLDIFGGGGAESGDAGFCIEQLDLDGARHYVVIQMECP